MKNSTIIKAIRIFVLLTSASLYSGESDAQSYSDLDRNIVKAYNSTPRNTAEVYANSMLILEKATKEENTNGAAWQLKARKLITVSCFYECTQAIDKKLYKQAYIWANRGERNGTAFGKVGEIPVKNLYDYLTFATKELKGTPMVKNSSPDELVLQSIISRGSMLMTQLQACSFLLMAGIGVAIPVNNF